MIYNCFYLIQIRAIDQLGIIIIYVYTYMLISKHPAAPEQLRIRNILVERNFTYKYLGSTINETWDHSVKVRYRIKATRSAIRLKKLLASHDLNLQTKTRLKIMRVVWGWFGPWLKLNVKDFRLKVLQYFKDILKDHVSNTKIFEIVVKNPGILFIVNRRNLSTLTTLWELATDTIFYH